PGHEHVASGAQPWLAGPICGLCFGGRRFDHTIPYAFDWFHQETEGRMKRSLPVINKWFPWIIAGVFGVWILSTLRMPRDKEWALSEFGKLPLLSNGRFQPMDSLARNSLLQML